jgi:hypothetical protein
LLYILKLQFAALESDYSRRIYSIFDVFGQIGGILGVFSPLAAVIISITSEFSFYIHLIQKMFMVKTHFHD